MLLSILLNEKFGLNEICIYLGGTMVSALTGYLCLNGIWKLDNDIKLDGFHGYVYEKPGIGLLFLLSCLGLLGFPITPTFIGVDLLFTRIRENQFPLILFTALSFVFIEISLLRIYARVFLGQHKKAYHPIAYRSS
jgi:formate hydrogenlyase subunit 3/multisubunit Na+/H+ antiporter MnhD subunit